MIDISMEIESHCEEIFKVIREKDKIGAQEIYLSLKMENNIDKVFQAGEGAGKSGSFFFFSHDNRFLIKTVTKTEKTLLMDIIEDL